VSEVKLVAVTRTDFGKGAARRTRRAGRIPAVLYGHGSDPLHVSLPGHETFLALKHANALFDVELDGQIILAIAKDVQREPVRQVIEHIDLIIVTKGEKVSVQVPVRIVGESVPGTIHFVELQTMNLEAEATNLPENVTVDISGMEAGTQVRAGQVALPEGSVLGDDPETVVVTIAVPHGTEEDEAEIAAAAEAAAASTVSGSTI
jgi:large subunit ribosomal protein L25